jgi:hypothetical protein
MLHHMAPWFVLGAECNGPDVRREMFNEFGEHCGYQLLDGEVSPLIAAAPAMLAALARIARDGDALSGYECQDIAQAAIDSAEGR